MLAFEGVGMRIGTVDVLVDASFSVAAGRSCGIAGPSGSGKTTLLHIAGMLLAPSRGAVTWNGARPADGAAWRRGHVGFIFQDFCLVPELTAVENVLLPLQFDRFRVHRERDRAVGLLREAGIATPGRRAGLMSRGEQQRVAIARALLRAPALILADEPTASLDAATGAMVGELLIGAARQAGAALLVVSHDPGLLARLDARRSLSAGRLA